MNGFASCAIGASRRVEPVQLVLAETGPDLARVVQGAVGVVVAERAARRRARAPPLARGPAADHELLAELVLDLAPRRRPPARFVPRVESLGHDPFEAELVARRQRGVAVAGARRRRLPSSVRSARALRAAARRSVYGRSVTRRPSSHSRSKTMNTTGTSRISARSRRRVAHVHAAAAGAGSRGGRVRRARRSRRRAARRCRRARSPSACELGIPRRDVAAVAARHAHATVSYEHEGAHAVPLHLVGPVGAGRHRRGRASRASVADRSALGGSRIPLSVAASRPHLGLNDRAGVSS